jgi:hypothetical protein
MRFNQTLESHATLGFPVGVQLAGSVTTEKPSHPGDVLGSTRASIRSAKTTVSVATYPAVGPDYRRRQIVLLISGTSYPFLNIFWTILIFFAWLIWLWIAVTVLIDLFRRHDISGWGKAAWVIFVIVLPFLGVLTYLIFYHTGMAERSQKQVETSQAQFDEYVRQTAGTQSTAEEIAKAKELLDNGTIDQAEFDAIKAKALS